MKRTVKYSSIIVAALFAAMPVVMNHSSLVKADQAPAPESSEAEGKAPVQNKGVKPNSPAEKNDDAKGTNKQGEQPASGDNNTNNTKDANKQNQSTPAGKGTDLKQGNKGTDAEPWKNAHEITFDAQND